MKNDSITYAGICAFVVSAIVAATICVRSASADNVTQMNSGSQVVTNDNGTVSRVFTESTVKTNGNMVTEHRRETRTTLDADGNLLESSTSEYAQSYTLGDGSVSSLSKCLEGKKCGVKSCDAANCDSFLGFKFGSEFQCTNFVRDVEEPTLLRASFVPEKKLAGFDDYFVYVTPTTHKVVKVYACAKNAVDASSSWRRNYLIEALEKRYRTWARPRSWCRPVYTFDLGSGRFVTASLKGSSSTYQTIVVAWDENMIVQASEEAEAIRKAALKTAEEKRKLRVDDAAAAF